MTKKEEILEHRGRLQAQGGGVEESENWAQTKPLSVKNALELLRRLIAKLSLKDYERRKREFGKAEQFIVGVGENGGIYAKTSQSFKVKGSKDERVDIEVLGGKAFVAEE